MIAGLSIALSLPPFGFWPLGVLGTALLAGGLGDQPFRARAVLGAGAGAGQYAVGLWWVNDFNVVGYILLVASSVALSGVVAAAVPGRRRLGVLIGLPAALMLSDWLRGHVPFGGLPIGGMALGQAGGPLAPVARIGGTLLVTGVTAMAGAALAQLWAAAGPRQARHTGRRLARSRAAPDPAREADLSGSGPARGAGGGLSPSRAGRRIGSGLARGAGGGLSPSRAGRRIGSGLAGGAGGGLSPSRAGRRIGSGLARGAVHRLASSRAAPDAAGDADRRGSRRAREAVGRLGSARATGEAARETVPAGGRRTRDLGPGGVGLALVVVLVVAGRLGPDGAGPGRRPALLVAAVQGGGPRGLHATETDPALPYQRQIEASGLLRRPLDLVVWPEDAVQLDRPVAETPEGAALSQLATRVGATVVAGVVEDVGSDRFRNAAVAWAPSGAIVARYDKVHRVPFGEYIPGRGLIGHLANVDLVPRDAIAGHGSGILPTPAGPLGTVISYEVFFEERARAAMRAGGQVLIVPTNASSYRTSQVPTQEVAAARLRAWETGRDAVQAAPTGYSAVISHDGQVRARSTLGRQEVVTGTVTLRSGRTLFVLLGDLPPVLVAIAGLGAAFGPRRPRWLLAGARRPPR